MEEGKWYRLDTAAKIYPAIMAPEQASVFRLSCILKDTIRPDLLAAALDITLRRYPGFCVRLEKGAFWCYFEHNPNQRLILRVKRFQVKNPAADQSSQADVLDMVVEQELVKKPKK